jgi:YVTN family beta-propeller protein
MRTAHLSLAIAALALIAPLRAQMPDAPLRSVSDPGVVVTRQSIAPAGVQSVFTGRVQGVVFGASSSEVWVLNSGAVFHMDWSANKVLAKIDLKAAGGLQGIRYDAKSNSAIVTAVKARHSGLLRVSGVSAATVADNLGNNVIGSPGLAPTGLAVVPLTGDSKAVVIDTASGAVRQTLATGIAPFGAVVNAAGTVAYVSNWGGRLPKEGDLTAVTGYARDADKVVVDARGVASTGTVRRYDLATGKMIHEIATGLHPTSMVWDEAHGRLYVANGNEDSISVIDTESGKVLRTIALQPFAEKIAGIGPTALAISADGETLYAACGGINAIALVKTKTGALAGSIPTAWYPAGLAISPDGKYLAVSNLLGAGSGWRDEPKRHYVHAVRGSIAVIPIPDAAQLAGFTAAVAENNRMNVPARPAPRPPRSPPPAARPRSSSTSSSSSRKTAPTIRSWATCPRAMPIPRSSCSAPTSRPTSTSSRISSFSSIISTPPVVTRPTATNGSRKPTKPIT